MAAAIVVVPVRVERGGHGGLCKVCLNSGCLGMSNLKGVVLSISSCAKLLMSVVSCCRLFLLDGTNFSPNDSSCCSLVDSSAGGMTTMLDGLVV